MVNEAKKKMQKARKGFTLVELLIVIIIIGILAGAMMLVAGSSRDAAEASKIISDLRNVKAAALMWLAENPGVTSADWEDMTNNGNNRLDELNKYLDRPIKPGDVYIFDANTITGAGGTDEVEVWALGRILDGERVGVKNNLEKHADNTGLIGGTGDEFSPTQWPPASADVYKANHTRVWVAVQ
jgi:prepilin-type N-terminal cleavage/methylation domain-containing protein